MRLSPPFTDNLYLGETARRLLIPGSAAGISAATLDYYAQTYYGIAADNSEADVQLPASLIADTYESGLAPRSTLLEAAVDLGALTLSTQYLDKIDDRISRQKATIIDRLEEIEPANPAIAAADLLFEPEYRGTFRKTGRPYYTHPIEAAVIGFEVSNRLREESGISIDYDLLNASIGGELGHDALEENTTPGSHYYYDKRRCLSFTPLLFQRILEDLDNPYAQPVAQSLSLFTRREIGPCTTGYREYVQYGARTFDQLDFYSPVAYANPAHLLFCINKYLDVFHNRHVEPKPIYETDPPNKRDQILSRNSDYDWCLGILPQAAFDNTDDPDIRLWLPEFFYRVREFKSSAVPAAVKHLSEYIYGNNVPGYWQS